MRSAYRERIIMALMTQSTAPLCFPAWKGEKRAQSLNLSHNQPPNWSLSPPFFPSLAAPAVAALDANSGGSDVVMVSS